MYSKMQSAPGWSLAYRATGSPDSIAWLRRCFRNGVVEVIVPSLLEHSANKGWRRECSQVHEDVLEREPGPDYISGEAEFLAEANPGSDVTVCPVDLDKEPLDGHLRALPHRSLRSIERNPALLNEPGRVNN
jgi:hypothetical protein